MGQSRFGDSSCCAQWPVMHFGRVRKQLGKRPQLFPQEE